MGSTARRAATVLTCSFVAGCALLAAGVQVAAPALRSRGATVLVAEELAVAVAGLGLAGAGCWVTLATLCCLGDLVRGRGPARGVPAPAPGLRRTLLRACAPAVGAAVLSVASPALADGSDGGPSPFGGLPLPDRPVLAVGHAGPATRHPAPADPADPVVRTVRAGDCLWSVAARLLGPGATPAGIDRAWRTLYRANRSRVGPDPDVVVAGTRLLVPASLQRTRPPYR